MLVAYVVGRIKSGAVFLGGLYLLAFALTFPFLTSHLRAYLGPAAILLIAMFAGFAIVTVFLNWFTIVVVGVPYIVGAALIVAGQTLWLGSPVLAIVFTPLTLIPDVGHTVYYVLRFSEMVTERAGLTVSALGGVVIAIAKRASTLNQVALVSYISCLALMGLLCGAVGIGPLVLFLFVWLIVYMKVSQTATAWPDIKRLFQVAATADLVLNRVIGSVEWKAWEVIGNTLAQIEGRWQTPVMGRLLGVTNQPIGIIWSDVLTVALLFGIWQPQTVWRIAPKALRDWISLRKDGWVDLLRVPSGAGIEK